MRPERSSVQRQVNFEATRACTCPTAAAAKLQGWLTLHSVTKTKECARMAAPLRVASSVSGGKEEPFSLLHNVRWRSACIFGMPAPAGGERRWAGIKRADEAFHVFWDACNGAHPQPRCNSVLARLAAPAWRRVLELGCSRACLGGFWHPRLRVCKFFLGSPGLAAKPLGTCQSPRLPPCKGLGLFLRFELTSASVF